jgi:hypothetical protein
VVAAAFSATALVALHRGKPPAPRTYASRSDPTGRAVPLTLAERRLAREELSARAATDEPAAATVAPPAAIERTATRFLAAFSSYELGDLSPPVRRALQRTSTAAFAAHLLSAPPRPLAGQLPPPRARIGSLDVAFTDAAGLDARVSGVARRGLAREPFSFLFRRTASGWRAASVAE